MWTEIVPITYIEYTKQVPDVDDNVVRVSATVAGALPGDIVKFVAYDGATIVGEATIPSSVVADI